MALSRDKDKKERQLKNLIPYSKENPSKSHGRPKGIVSYIKDKTNGLKDAIDLHVQVMRGLMIPGMKKPPSLYYRLDSAKWLFEKCYGNRPLMSEEDAEKYDLRAVILLELTEKQHGTLGNTTPEQIVEVKQSLQDQDKEQGPGDVQVQPPPEGNS